MAQKILVIGGVALGPKAACRCKRLMPDAEITLVDENLFISYGGCGIPYYVSGEVNNLDDLRATPYHTVRDPEFFRTMKGITVRNQTRAMAIDRAAKTLLVRNVVTGEEEKLPYDKLVLATGATPRMPPVEGHDLKNVLTLTRLEAADVIRKACEHGQVNEAVIVGGGFIGLEAAVALSDMWGVKVSVVEMMDQMLPGVLSHNMGKMAAHDCEAHGLSVYTSEKVVKLEGKDGAVCKVITDKRELPAQLVIFAAGFLPNGQLAKDAGLEVAPFGAIVVNEKMQTSDPDIYAGGDCVAIKNLITGKLGYLPLGSMANRQGRVIGTNLAGGDASFPGFVGTWAVKLFDMSFCGAGLTVERARKEGYDAISVAVEQLDRAHFYPEKNMMSLELVVDKSDRRVLGIQGACTAGDALKARIDAVAAVLQYGQAHRGRHLQPGDLLRAAFRLRHGRGQRGGQRGRQRAGRPCEAHHLRRVHGAVGKARREQHLLHRRPSRQGRSGRAGRPSRMALHLSGRDAQPGQRSAQGPSCGHHLQHRSARL